MKRFFLAFCLLSVFGMANPAEGEFLEEHGSVASECSACKEFLYGDKELVFLPCGHVHHKSCLHIHGTVKRSGLTFFSCLKCLLEFNEESPIYFAKKKRAAAE
jgi:hypothetical protein